MVNVLDSSIRTKHIAPVLGNIKYFNVDVHNGAMMYLRHLYVYLFLGMFFFFCSGLKVASMPAIFVSNEVKVLLIKTLIEYTCVFSSLLAGV